MKRKILTILLAFIGLGLIVFAILLSLGLFRKKGAGILIETEPVSTVFIDGLKVGVTPYESNREAGEIVVRIVPNADESQGLDDYETKISLEPGVKTIIKRFFNANDELISGVTVSFEKIGGEESLITVVTIPSNAQIFIDEKAYGFAPLRTKVSAGDHKLLVSGQGYLDKLLPTRVYKGYKLTAVVKLAKDTSPQPTLEPVLSESTKNLGKIKISDTGVGFLRVRSKPDISSEVVGQVKPGEIYDVLEENADWYKIKVTLDTHEGEVSEIEGWVSANFSKHILDP